MSSFPGTEADPAANELLTDAVRRVLRGEELQPFCDWFAREMGALIMSNHPVEPDVQDAARRFQRVAGRTLWAMLPVPFNRWRHRALPKVERNDPCHCGSGLKFKQCCAEFAGALPPFGPDGLYALALSEAEPAMLAPELARLVPGELLGMAAMDWNGQERPERTIAVLGPLFQQCKDLDGRHELAFDALMDALQAQGLETQRAALAAQVGTSRDKILATAARCRHASMLGDQGDFDAAWAMFQSAQRLNSSDPQLLHLELTLLLAQGREEDATLRAPLLAARARKAGLDDLAEMLLQLGEGGFAAAYGHADDVEADEPHDLEWEKHLKSVFPDYPRLHGLLTAIAWSPDLIMPSKWLEIVMGMRAQPQTGLAQSTSLDALNADMNATMVLLNTINAQVLDTPHHLPAPVQDVMALAASEEALFAWAAGFVQGAQLAAGEWLRVGRPVNDSQGTFGEFHALAARAPGGSATRRATNAEVQPSLSGLEAAPRFPIETLALGLADLWRVIAPLRQARAGVA